MLELQGSDKFKIRNNIAKFNIKLGKNQDGILILEDLALLSQNAYDITLELASAYISVKEYKKALERYMLLLNNANQKEAKMVNMLICELYIIWAIDRAQDGKFEESDGYLRNAMQYNPLNPEVYYSMAKNCFLQKNYSGAVEQITKAIEYDKDNANSTKNLLLLADSHHNLGNFFEEKKALSDLLKYDEKSSEGLLRLGIMYSAQHDMKNAEETFKAALESNPELIDAKYNLALIYETNNKDKAKELYMEILEDDPTNEEAKRALSDLSVSDTF
ncbi:tetratricopeptide repeat protein, partial [bacterium]|nr:tetratricopeptide repeat protein [bacterium]